MYSVSSALLVFGLLSTAVSAAPSSLSDWKTASATMVYPEASGQNGTAALHLQIPSQPPSTPDKGTCELIVDSDSWHAGDCSCAIYIDGGNGNYLTCDTEVMSNDGKITAPVRFTGWYIINPILVQLHVTTCADQACEVPLCNDPSCEDITFF